ncbi:MAG: protein-glutamate O-methyltransferase CheR [Deltaproteobacteria bacterium]|nr:protein-glutamate O-methyltransferase CheR [Deltaproteobacteria bacterium]
MSVTLNVNGENTFMSVSELRDTEFEKISRLVYGHCGINLHDGKKELVKARLSKRLREGKFKSFGDYYKYVVTEEGTDEMIAMIDSLSTNLTYFFREESHFYKLRDILQSRLSSVRSVRQPQRIRIWSAGCSSGEEAFSIAMTVREYASHLPIECKITATDISTRVLDKAVKGIFPKDKLKNLAPEIVKRFFQLGYGQQEGNYRIKKEIRDMVSFSRFNLMEMPPADFLFDIIFCRNVMIYFDKATQVALLKRFYQCLNKNGYFFIGHSESIAGLDHEFIYVEPSVYRK